MTPAEAARVIVAQCAPLPAEPRPLKEALDLVLAADVKSPLDLPPWDNSAMDGYAVRAADVAGATSERPVTLSVVETVSAGHFPEVALRPGQATRVATGAPVPAGTDGVIRQEDTEARPDGRVAIRDARDARQNVRRRGVDIRRDAVVLTRGTVLGPAQLGVLASIAQATPPVYRPPRVAYFGSGDEIVDLDQQEAILTGRKIATANSYTLHGMIRRAGGIPQDLGVAQDTEASLSERFETAVGADLVVTTGGVSVGEHDLVRSVVAKLGGEIKLWRVRMRPGAPLGFGVVRGVPWIGLPGNPVSTMVTAELFVRPAIRRLLGAAHPFRRTVPVKVAEPLQLGPRLQHFLRVIVAPEPDGALVARLTGAQGSNILTSMARATALLIVPEDCPEVPAGATLQALVLDDPQAVASPPY